MPSHTIWQAVEDKRQSLRMCMVASYGVSEHKISNCGIMIGRLSNSGSLIRTSLRMVREASHPMFERPEAADRY